ncbi:carbohydrate ABC transporter permease [Adhaeretor mobilis]|uniref:Lactose transport system permease protein LacF n=1 Tax=Adhaeretor mobilis TaxID=1930276 RepID=A0A517MS78_9BACT|nr:sugar ABC transporter permease [Adhaeretor mobilis]QDS97739.1 Lactose transport system permease protein LacF [Adhaeretor mobilis]
MSLKRQELIAGLTMTGPWVLGLLTLTLYPFAASLWWSFCEYDLLGQPRWVGGSNYARLARDISTGGQFWQALGNTAYYAVASVLLSVLVGVSLATLLSQTIRGRTLMRTLCFLPAVVPTVAAAVLWMWLLDPQAGLVNKALTTLELPAQNWFRGTSAAAWPTSWPTDAGGRVFGSKDGLVLMSVWGIGNLLVIYLAAIGDVPRALYEAAEIDGASPWRKFLHVTLPMLTPVIFFNVVMGLIQSVQAFTDVYLVSDGQGDPAGATMTVSLYLFLTAFKDLDMGYASAMAWLLFVIVAMATWWLFRTSRKWVHQ